MTCNRCRFAVKDDNSDTSKILWCRRAPPRVVIQPNGDITGFHAPVGAQAWCGEFKLALKRLFRGHVKT